ncbi:unnamed protein product [Fraxinus pennsylvanica]|uniref:Uncharacterized protein n=1 Tax=Fraxinus pennsylvanica TaxID=56036 RepID=A0AAD1ZP58_9LAMI|nr:unnamed protein product [Fraxinus pennsylvanica]
MCRNCLTPYWDQNPGGGKFTCLYCGHISKRPVLDLPESLDLGSSGIMKYLVGKCGTVFNGKIWLENGNWVGGPFDGKSSYWKKNGGEKIFKVSSSRDDKSTEAELIRLLDKRGENGGNFDESRGEKARRKVEKSLEVGNGEFSGKTLVIEELNGDGFSGEVGSMEGSGREDAKIWVVKKGNDGFCEINKRPMGCPRATDWEKGRGEERRGGERQRGEGGER